MSLQARGGCDYFILFIDVYTCYGYLYPIRNKLESFEKFKAYQNEMEKQLHKSVKSLRLDRNGECLSQEFQDYLRDNGIISQWTLPCTPQHDVVLKMTNRTVLDIVRSMMSLVSLPKSLWQYALREFYLIVK